MSDVKGQTIAGYELRERIGTGGFGAVYRAYQTTVGREVALKIILPGFANHPDFIRRFELEAQIIARLEHLHIVPLYDYWRDTNGAYLVMRLLRGGSLKEALQRGAYDLESAALLLDQISAALSAAHQQKVIHRDLKPGNILLDEDGNAYLADFGIAKDLSRKSDGTTLTDSIIGSPDYFSPEQARSDDVTVQTDIYSLGVVLYELLTGEHPFPNVSTVERLYKHLNEPLPSIANLQEEVREAINDVIRKATVKNPVQRYPDALAMAAAFREAAALNKGTTNESLVELLTPREQEILQFMIEGRSNKQIADQLFITIGTVKWYITRIYQKLGVRNRVQAILRARELPLIGLGFTGEAHSVQSPTLQSIASPAVKTENPYKGLRSFQTADYQDFFGREKLVEKIMVRMAEKEDRARFLAVVGPSGSGKSSVIKAGVIPAFWRGGLPRSDKWFIAEMLPSARPLDELEVALTRIAATSVPNLREHLQRDQHGLARAAALILPNDGSELVLVIDQFEEVFTLVSEEAARTHFLDLLYAAVTEPRSRVRVLITLRADFYDRPLHYAEFGELVRSRMETILPLSAKELERAVMAPVERQGLTFEEGLVTAIVTEMHYQSGALPLLQYALTELFERRQGRLLTHAAYQAMGGAAGALAQRAEGLYDEFEAEAQNAIQQMFLRLVTVESNTEDTRRRVRRSELLALLADGDVMDEVIDTFADYRLLTLDHDPITHSPIVEVAHEAILREWERLHIWLTESHSDILLQRQLAHDADEWNRSKQDASFLLRGTRLEQFESWAAATSLALTSPEQVFLRASMSQRQREEEKETDRQHRELELARQSAKRLRSLVGVLIVGVILALALSGIALTQRQQAEINFTHSERQRLAAQATSLLERETDNETAVLLALHSLHYGYSVEADAALVRALSHPFPRELYQYPEFLTQAIFSPDGQSILTGWGDGIARLIDVKSGAVLREFVGHTNGVSGVAFSHDGRFVFTVSWDMTARMWDAQTGETLLIFEGHEDFAQAVAVSPDNSTLATASTDSTVRLWDIRSGKELHRLTGHNGAVSGVTFSPDGRLVLSVGDDAVARLWDVKSGAEIQHFSGHTAPIYGAAFSPDGHTVATASDDLTARLWDVDTAQPLCTMIGHHNFVRDVHFSPDGQTLVTVSDDGTARLWSVITCREQNVLIGPSGVAAYAVDGSQIVTTIARKGIVELWNVHADTEPQTLITQTHALTQAAFSADGRFALTAGDDFTAHLWDLQTGQETQHLSGQTDTITALALSTYNHYALVGGIDGSLRLWNVQTGEILHQLEGHRDRITAVSFSPDASLAVSVSVDRSLRWWNAQTGELIVADSSFSEAINSAVFSRDGHYVIVGSQDGTARLFDSSTHAEVRRFSEHDGGVNGAAISADGRQVLTTDDGGSGYLWDLNTGANLYRLNGHSDWVMGGRFSEDGHDVLTFSADGTARLWDTQTGQQVRLLTGQFLSVGFSESSNSMLTVGTDNSIRAWRQNLDDVEDFACIQVGRDFTQQERIGYDIRDEGSIC